MDKVREQTDEQVRRLVGKYLSGELDGEELSVRIDGLIIAAGKQGRPR